MAPLPPLAEQLAALFEGLCPVCHAGLEPLGSHPLHERTGACHNCCPCTLWEWRSGDLADPRAQVSRCRFHLMNIPEGDHC